MSEAPAKPHKGLYFVHPVVDVLLMGVLSIGIYFWFRSNTQVATDPRVAAWAALAVWGCNWPHFSATSYRLYRSRDLVGQYPVTALATPVLMVGAVVASFLAPETVAPYFCKLFLLWSPYHFSGQTLGLALVYSRRAGLAFNAVERYSLSGFIYSTFAMQTARAEVGSSLGDFYGVQYPALGIPGWVPDLIQYFLWACGAVFALCMALRMVRAKRFVPLIVFVPPITQYVWFVAPQPGHFNHWVPFFHSLQYMFISWCITLKERLDEQKETPSGGFVLSESMRWAVVNFFGGAFLFWLLPRIGQRFGHSLDFSTAVILSAVQIHHFFIDGVIWKLKNPRVRSPLAVTMHDLLHAPASATAPATAGST